MDEEGLTRFLDEQGIAYSRVDHPPVFTCAEAERLRPDMTGVSTKNLFLRDEKGERFFLLMTACEKRANLGELGKRIGAKKLHLGPEDRLEELLGVTRGAVTALGLANDTGHKVELLVDEEIWGADAFLCHPLVNTATLVLSKADLERFFALTGHTPQLVTI